MATPPLNRARKLSYRFLFCGFNFRGLPINRENRENWTPRKFPAIQYIPCARTLGCVLFFKCCGEGGGEGGRRKGGREEVGGKGGGVEGKGEEEREKGGGEEGREKGGGEGEGEEGRARGREGREGGKNEGRRKGEKRVCGLLPLLYL